ncbi:MAG: hypothetical protein EZS28_041197, partial [Streblomastix strix]
SAILDWRDSVVVEMGERVISDVADYWEELEEKMKKEEKELKEQNEQIDTENN